MEHYLQHIQKGGKLQSPVGAYPMAGWCVEGRWQLWVRNVLATEEQLTDLS